MPTPSIPTEPLDRLLHRHALPLTGGKEDYTPLKELIGDAHLVLLGEATHGTREFYRERARITRELIEEKGFQAVAVEADWPDAYRVNKFVRGRRSTDRSAGEALSGFNRFPAWMWRNTEFLDFISWLHGYNSVRPDTRQAGFYGLDLYSLSASIEAVLAYLDTVDPVAAQRARYRYSCFEDFGEDPQSYGYAAAFDFSRSCEEAVITQLTELHRQGEGYLRHDGEVAEDEQFYAEQNARLVRNAERYYRGMFIGHVESWNLRDRHMVETLEALARHLGRDGTEKKIVVWAHNSHLGDARATEMADQGELNVGQLVRQLHGADAVLVGFTTYSGTVTAASDWGAHAETTPVRPALAGSYERLFHSLGIPSFLLPVRRENEMREALRAPMLERAIGVIYRPTSERLSHYFHARLGEQFDAVLHFDETRAVEPLERVAALAEEELPETFPEGV